MRHGDELVCEASSERCVMMWCDEVDEERSGERRLTLMTIKRVSTRQLRRQVTAYRTQQRYHRTSYPHTPTQESEEMIAAFQGLGVEGKKGAGWVAFQGWAIGSV